MMKVYKTFTVVASKISCSFVYEGYVGPSTSGFAGNLVQRTDLPKSGTINGKSPPNTKVIIEPYIL